MNCKPISLTMALLALTAAVTGCASDDDDAAAVAADTTVAPDAVVTTSPAAASTAPTVEADTDALGDEVVVTTAGPSAASTAPPAVDGEGDVVADGEPWVVFHGVELGLTLARIDGTGLHTILEGYTDHPDWSPDGAEIAYVDGGEVRITDTTGVDHRPLVTTYPDGLDGLYWEDPAWSRDGTQIAMVGYGGSPEGTPTRSVLAVVDVASGALTVAGELALADGLHSFPRWSPAGDALVLNVDHFTGENYDGGTVAIVRRTTDGSSAPQPITEHGQYGRVDWHPTEDLIVFGQYDIASGRRPTSRPTCSRSVPTAPSARRSPSSGPARPAPPSRPGPLMGASCSPTSPVTRTSIGRSRRSTPTAPTSRSSSTPRSSARATAPTPACVRLRRLERGWARDSHPASAAGPNSAARRRSR